MHWIERQVLTAHFLGLTHDPGTEMTAPQSNARVIAELQAVTLAIRMFGLSRLPEVMVAKSKQEKAK